MDNLTHTLLGVTLANAGLKQRFGRGTVMVMAVTSNLPDVDLLCSVFAGGDGMMMRRMFTHSVFGLPVLALVAATVFRLLYRHQPWLRLLGLTLLAMAVHVFLDLVNSYGVVVLYPFNRVRHELAWVFIIDLVLWTLLLAPLLLGLVKSRWTDLRRLSVLSLAGIAAYVGLCAAGRARSDSLLRQTALTHQLSPDFSYVFPEALGPHRFRGVLRQAGEYRLYLVNPWTSAVELKETVLSHEGAPEVQAAQRTEEAAALSWFFKAPVWRVLPPGAGQGSGFGSDPPAPDTIVEVTDLRFHSVVITRNHPFHYRFRVTGGKVESLGWRE